MDEDAIDVNEDLNNTCPIIGTFSQSGLCRWRKCYVIANKFMAKLDSILQHFDVEEKRDIVQRILEHDSLKELLLEYITSNKGSEKALQALCNMWEAYATLTSVK